MSYNPISGFTLQNIKQNGQVAEGYYLKFYIADTTTAINMATDSTGSTLLSEAKFNDIGMPISNPLDNSTIFIPHIDQAYRFVVYRNKADADADDTASAVVNIPNTQVFQTLSNGILSDIEYTGVAGQDTFTLSYTVGSVRVLYNGVYLPASEYTATDGISLTLTDPVADNLDVITILTVSFDDVEFTGTTTDTLTLNYTVGKVRVLYNGIQLSKQDYTATDGIGIVLDEPIANTSDIITVIKL